jgi:hypothetical protein
MLAMNATGGTNSRSTVARAAPPWFVAAATAVAVFLLSFAAADIVRPLAAASAAGAVKLAANYPATAEVTADFSVNSGPGHPGVFGAKINHNENPAKLDSLRQSGFSLLRRDAYLSEIVPNSTVEIWNEPNIGFIDTTGSPYTDNLTAYRDIYLQASNTIRTVDHDIPIGGPVVANATATDWGTALLQDTRIRRTTSTS